MGSTGMAATSQITTSIASHDLHHIWVRGIDLTADIMGKLSFGEVVFLLIGGRLPDAQERRLIDAVLVSLVEHGLTPSAIVSRVTYAVASESIQGAVAAGLLGAGSLVLGSMEDCGKLLTRIDTETRAGTPRAKVIESIVDEYRAAKRNLPGIGHAIHTEGDPRAARLYAIAEECGKRGAHLDALEELVRAAEVKANRKLPINATGAVAAILLELGIPWQVHRGLALVSRSAGLVAHIAEELSSPIYPAFREATKDRGHLAPGGEGR